MKKSALFLLLGVGLWACQDQVVNPDLQPSFAKGGNSGKPQEPSQMLVGFLHPDIDPRWDDFFVDKGELRVDISAAPQLINARVDEDGVLEFQGDDYHLVLHFQDELNMTDLSEEIPWPEGVSWCNSEICARGSGCQEAVGFNLLQDLQDLSTKYGGLTGGLGGDSGVWGIGFTLMVEGEEGIDDGEYHLDTWNVRGRSQGVYEDPISSEGHDITGYGWWRNWNSPIRVFRKDLDAKKNDIWSHITTCGYFDPGSPYRRAAHEIFAGPAPPEG